MIDIASNYELAIIITIPSNIEWEDYQRELLAAATGQVLNFKVANFPELVGPGDKCYVVHRGYIKGWQLICGLSEKEFTCTTTGKPYKGRFIERTGKFNYLDEPLPYKGFQGFRYFNFNEYLENLEIQKKVGEELPENFRYVSEDTHPEVPAGVYNGEMCAWTFTVNYKGKEVVWKSKNGGIRGLSRCNIFVTSNGYAYIMEL